MIEKGTFTRSSRTTLWIGLLVLALFWLIPFTAWTAETKIGFINMQKAVANTKEFKSALNKFKKDFEKEQKVIVSREQKVQRMLEDLNKQGFVLDPALKKQKQEDFLNEKKKLERYVQDRNEEFASKEKEITNKILKKMLEIIRKIGKKKKLTMIIEKKALFYTEASADLTDLATKTYDKTSE